MKRKFIVWGIGAVYNKHLNLLRYYELKNEIEIVAVTANNLPAARTLDGYKLIHPDALSAVEFEYLVIMSDLQFMEIRDTALSIGVAAEKILSYKILDIPNLELEQYIKLKESRISIISNNCWGGTIYNTLGIECLSPFKNLFLKDDSYLRMLKNLDYYLGCKPEFGGLETDVHNGNVYPILKLDDVQIHCNHDSEYETAVQKWNRRLMKLNRENLFIEMYTEDEECAHEFIRMQKFKKKICFVPFKSYEKGLYELELRPGQSEFWEVVISSARNGGQSIAYNIIDLLNGNGCSRYTS